MSGAQARAARRSVPWLAALALVVGAWAALRAGVAAPGPGPGSGSDGRATFKIDSNGLKQRVEVERLDSGTVVYRLRDGKGEPRELTPDEFAGLLLEPTGPRWWQQFFNVSSALGLAWVTLGVLGQLLFSGRMIVQWLASERLGRSTVPTVFWWLSIGGSALLIVYFLWRRDVVGVLGQATGCFIYVRNLVLIARAERTIERAG